MGANAFNSNGNSSGAILGSFNKNDLYNGLPLHAALGISNAIEHRFSLEPTWPCTKPLPPAGTPNFFVTIHQLLASRLGDSRHVRSVAAEEH
jgi:hypothetical protein